MLKYYTSFQFQVRWDDPVGISRRQLVTKKLVRWSYRMVKGYRLCWTVLMQYHMISCC